MLSSFRAIASEKAGLQGDVSEVSRIRLQWQQERSHWGGGGWELTGERAGEP